MTVSAAYFYFLQSADYRWAEDQDLSALNWQDETAVGTSAVVPLEAEKTEGPEPSTMTVRVVGDPNKITNNVVPDSATVVYSNRRPNGSDGDFPFPAGLNGTGGVYPPFTIFRLMRCEEDTLDSRGSATCVFVGILTDYTLSKDEVLGEYCELTITEIARWHMGRIGVYGVRLYQLDDGAGNAADKWQVNALPCFNADGKPDQLYTTAGDAVGNFVNPEYNSKDGVQQDATKPYAGYWRLGDVLNYLWYEYQSATLGSQDGNGAVFTGNYLKWNIADAVTVWPFLFATPVGSKFNGVRNFALGGMSLAEAIDQIVTKAGPYGWTCEWDNSEQKYVLYIYDLRTGNGETSKDYTRGGTSDDVGATPPDVTDFNLRVNYDAALTQVKALGKPRKLEFTVDTAGGLSYGLGGLAEGWSSADETAYDGATDDEKNSLGFPNVYQRFVFAKDFDWACLDDAAHYSGRRPVLPALLTRVWGKAGDADASAVRLKPLAWRYYDGDWELAPAAVSVSLWPDGSIRIGGKADGDLARWAEMPGGGAYYIRVTIAVEADARLTTSTSPQTDKPAGWPTLDKVMYSPEYEYEAAAGAILLVDGDLKPVFDNPTSTQQFGSAGDEYELKNDQARLDAATERTLSAAARPRLSGTITLHELDWDIMPGQFVWEITGGGERPSWYISAVVSHIQYTGLSDGNRRMVLTLGGDTA